jgi:phytanoyl-CoA hydroxylase
VLLTPDQVDHFDTHGYLLLPGRVPPDLLARLRAAADGWTAGPTTPDHLYSGGSLWRVDHLHDKGSPASLELLGSPEVLGIAESLAGPDLVPTYESLVVKAAGNGAAVPWHQDAVHGREHRLFNVDVYLDDAEAGAGALHVVPGSQRAHADACALRDDHGWAVPGAVELPVRAGDVLVHDDMLVHGSPPGTGPRQRRTVYLEFRPAASIREHGPWDADWADARLRLLRAALAAHAAARPGAEQYRWRPSRQPAPGEVRLRVAHGAHTPGEWCSAG